MSTQKKGRCLCEAVQFEVEVSGNKVHVCHCGICQKWHGGSGLSVQCSGEWTIKGEEHLTWYNSSEWAQRGFCKQCGTHLFFKTNSGDYHGVTAGSLDTQEGLELESHIFIDKKPAYYDFADNCPRLTEKEFLEHIGAA